MKAKPDLLMVLALVFGIGIAITGYSFSPEDPTDKHQEWSGMVR